MSFRAHLDQLLKDVDGSVACSVMGFDGIAVETAQSQDPGLDLSAMLVEYGNILGKLKEAANLVVCPSLDADNIAFNLLKAGADGLHIGPMLLGTAKPAHVLTPSVTARGILNMTALAVVEAQRLAEARG